MTPQERLKQSIDMLCFFVDHIAPEEDRAKYKSAFTYHAQRAFAAGISQQYQDAFSKRLSDKVMRVGGYGYDSLGGVWVTFYVVEAPDTEGVYAALAELGIEEQHCQHEFDCCAHYYGNHPSIIQSLNGPTEYLVEWRQYQNV